MQGQSNITLARLRSFIAVAEERQFHRAAERLGLSPPALSTQIRQLEADCGLPLFDRTTRSLRLTVEGERFLRRAAAIVADLSAAVLELRDHAEMKRGRVMVAATPSVASCVLPAVVTRFTSAHPGVSVAVIEASAGDAARLVEEGSADFALGPRPADGSGLAFSRLLRDRFIGLVASGHPLARSGRMRLAGFLAQPIITPPADTNIRTALEAAARQCRLSLQAVHQVRQHQTIVALVAAGLGVTVLPNLALHILDLKRVRFVELGAPELWREIGVIRRRGGVGSAAAGEFLRLLSAGAGLRKPLYRDGWPD